MREAANVSNGVIICAMICATIIALALIGRKGK